MTFSVVAIKLTIVADSFIGIVTADVDLIVSPRSKALLTYGGSVLKDEVLVVSRKPNFVTNLSLNGKTRPVDAGWGLI